MWAYEAVINCAEGMVGREAKHHEAIHYVQSLYGSTPVIQYVCHQTSFSLTSTKNNIRCKTKGPCDISEKWVGHFILCT